jgi:protocatechuate 3,4-dioxygenase beta subunit
LFFQGKPLNAQDHICRQVPRNREGLIAELHPAPPGGTRLLGSCNGTWSCRTVSRGSVPVSWRYGMKRAIPGQRLPAHASLSQSPRGTQTAAGAPQIVEERRNYTSR